MSLRRLLLGLAGGLDTKAQLDAQLARHQAHFHGALYDPISVALVRRALARILD